MEPSPVPSGDPAMSAGRRLLIIAPLVLVPLLGCGKNNPAAPAHGPAAAEPTALGVKVTTPKRQPVGWSVEQPASILPYESTPVAAKFDGYVKRIAPDEAAKRDQKGQGNP